MMETDSIETITNGFPNPPNSIPRIRGKPTRQTLDDMLDPLIANAASVQTNLGGGKYGYAAICMSPARYNAIPNTIPFITPLSPGDYIIDTSIKNAAHREERYHEYTLRLQKYKTYDRVEQACKNIFLACVPSEC